MKSSKFSLRCSSYLNKLNNSFNNNIFDDIEALAIQLKKAWINKNQIFICGNGGSAANAMHLANDLIYGSGACGSDNPIPGLKIEALSSNTSVITCLANDTGYMNIFSYQLEVKANEGDILIALSGSGNSQNIIKAIEIAKNKKVKTFGIVAFNGGKLLKIVDHPIHFKINDMQIAEDTQLIVGHLCMQWLSQNKYSSNDEIMK